MAERPLESASPPEDNGRSNSRRSVHSGGDDTICAIATPPGEGGVGVVRISGPLARPILERIFRTPRGRVRSRWESHRLVLGVVYDEAAGEPIDEVLAVFMAGPRSFTGEDVVELQAHGGPVPLRRMVDAALRQGARSPQPGEFTLRAFMNGRLDLAQAEAVIDIIRARTDRSLRAAMGQFGGKLSQRVRSLQDPLLDWMALLEAQIDFPEDDIPASTRAEHVARADAVLAEIDALLASAEAGRVLRDGVRVAIVGKPNVGKSSLLNALLGEARAIVTDVPGTTRDSIEEWLSLEGIPMRVVDTAGIRHAPDAIEALGIERSRRHLAACDLALVVLDATQPLDAEDRAILHLSAERPRIAVLNKMDAAGAGDPLDDPDLPRMAVSALRGEGIRELSRAIAARVCGGLDVEHEEVGGNLRHRDALYRSRSHVAAARGTAAQGLPADFISIDLRAAVVALGEITGASVTDEILHRIFSQFCLGK